MIDISFWQTALSFSAIIAAGASFYFSTKSRRADTVKLRGIYGARTNICMGLMLIIIALIQLMLFEGSTIRLIVGTIFLLLGLFNLFAGIRNHSAFNRMKEQ
ncbi:hypothetical protein DUZ99_07215 [Xylanibacillus composti]|uniref:YtpI-like protein n=1 Tax=Xylanibacillus composti TaxID=1572762 RepID=A0A8J4H561_9BACL|nr:YtpI family protein [Xylanibacillus composti]MDT9724782.1 hypothetical protein [Xylanibacillus composti]GIQ69865.1 hypothetical protein XYCOK13_26890 [Xylanibacillus composti]